jgi:protein TonB
MPSRGTGVEVGSTLVVATPTKRILPVLPKAAGEQRRFGPVIIEITVAADGTVQSPRVLRGDSLLNDLALEAVRQWRYEPFVVAGQSQPKVISVAVPFTK